MSQKSNELEVDTWLTRERAAQVLTQCGIPTKAATLSHLASRGNGPRYSLINGRAVYKRADLEAWVRSQTRGAEAGDRGVQGSVWSRH